MLLDIKKLFSKDVTLGRFEYLKLELGLLLFPVVILALLIIFYSNTLLFYVFSILEIVTLLAYLVICWVATYKRLKNIFNNRIVALISLTLYFFSGVFIFLQGILNLLLFLIPGKKKSDYIMSNTFFWVTFSYLLLLLFTLFIVLIFSGISRWIVSASMADTLKINDRVFVNIFDKDYHRGDIIVHNTDSKSLVFIKRIIALPGEKVEIKTLEDGAKYIFINDKLLEEPYVKSVYEYPECSSDMKCKPIVVPENRYYVLGDNRGNSLDSRYYGTIDKKAIKGKVSNIWFPSNRQRKFKVLKYNID